MSIDSDHVNYLIYRYLIESGETLLPALAAGWAANAGDMKGESDVCGVATEEGKRAKAKGSAAVAAQRALPCHHVGSRPGPAFDLPPFPPRVCTTGYQHSSFTFTQESGVMNSSVAGTKIPPGSLIAHLQRALNYVQAEVNLTDVRVACDKGGDRRLFLCRCCTQSPRSPRLEREHALFLARTRAPRPPSFLCPMFPPPNPRAHAYVPPPPPQDGRPADLEDLDTIEALNLIESVQVCVCVPVHVAMSPSLMRPTQHSRPLLSPVLARGVRGAETAAPRAIAGNKQTRRRRATRCVWLCLAACASPPCSVPRPSTQACPPLPVLPAAGVAAATQKAAKVVKTTTATILKVRR